MSGRHICSRKKKMTGQTRLSENVSIIGYQYKTKKSQLKFLCVSFNGLPNKLEPQRHQHQGLQQEICDIWPSGIWSSGIWSSGITAILLHLHLHEKDDWSI
jgi:hypothetical protein